MTDSPLPYPAEAIAQVRNILSKGFMEGAPFATDIIAIIDYAERAGEAMRWRTE